MIRRYLLPYRRQGSGRVAKATRRASFRSVVNRGSVRGLGWRIKDPSAYNAATANLRIRFGLGVQQANANQQAARQGATAANGQLRQFRRLRRFALMVDSGHIFIAGWLASVQARRRATQSAQTSLRLWRTMVYLPPWDPTTYTGYIDLTELDRNGGFIELARGAVTELQRVDGFIEIARRELTELEK
jgi:hypothetical protein